MGVGSFGEGVCFVVSPERGFLGDLVRFLIAYLLNTVFSVPVKRGRLYRTESDCKEMGYALKAGQLTYDCRYSTMHGMPVTGGRGFRGLKPLWYNGVPP
jgi:hypothetical protein